MADPPLPPFPAPLASPPFPPVALAVTPIVLFAALLAVALAVALPPTPPLAPLDRAALAARGSGAKLIVPRSVIVPPAMALPPAAGDSAGTRFAAAGPAQGTWNDVQTRNVETSRQQTGRRAAIAGEPTEALPPAPPPAVCQSDAVLVVDAEASMTSISDAARAVAAIATADRDAAAGAAVGDCAEVERHGAG